MGGILVMPPVKALRLFWLGGGFVASATGGVIQWFARFSQIPASGGRSRRPFILTLILPKAAATMTTTLSQSKGGPAAATTPAFTLVTRPLCVYAPRPAAASR